MKAHPTMLKPDRQGNGMVRALDGESSTVRESAGLALTSQKPEPHCWRDLRAAMRRERETIWRLQKLSEDVRFTRGCCMVKSDE